MLYFSLFSIRPGKRTILALYVSQMICKTTTKIKPLVSVLPVFFQIHPCCQNSLHSVRRRPEICRIPLFKLRRKNIVPNLWKFTLIIRMLYPEIDHLFSLLHHLLFFLFFSIPDKMIRTLCLLPYKPHLKTNITDMSFRHSCPEWKAHHFVVWLTISIQKRDTVFIYLLQITFMNLWLKNIIPMPPLLSHRFIILSHLIKVNAQFIFVDDFSSDRMVSSRPSSCLPDIANLSFTTRIYIAQQKSFSCGKSNRGILQTTVYDPVSSCLCHFGVRYRQHMTKPNRQSASGMI